jgi:AcrR family transcriptional regulator
MPPATTRSAKRPYHHGGLADALKQAALEIVAERGLDAVTMSEAARRAGVSSGAPYHHYGSLDALLSATAVDAYQRFRARQQQARASRGDDPRAELRAIIDDFFAFAADDPASFTLIFDSNYTQRSTDLRPFAREDYELVLALISRITGAPPEQCRELALGASSVVFGQAKMTMSRYSPVSEVAEAPELTHSAIALMIEGFSARRR